VIDRIKDPQFKSALIYPLFVQGQKIGSMVLLKEVTGGFNKDVVNIIKTFGNQAGVSIENFRLLRSALQNERYQEEIKIAKRVQESLLPNDLESNGTMDIVAFSTAADEVGGDYYDVYRVNDDKMVIIIGDVSGKGTSAAFNMSQMKGVFHSLVPLNLSAKDFLIRANDALSRCLERTSFITLSYFIIDTNSRQIEFCRAGHCPSLFYSQQKGKTCFLENKGMGLGIIRNQKYSQYIEVNQLSYGSNDLLVLYTDGITEAKNAENIEFGYERLQQIVAENVQKPAGEIQKVLIDELYKFTKSESIADDYTTLIIKFK
ncbi:MAG: GAF domain-containing SpoIIE family protein phosphatase, partial [Cyclobacteriaceae bacterium]